MKVAYHRLVQRDISRILSHYDGITPRLGDEFWNEMMQLVELMAEKPERFRIVDRGLRRANLRRFPYHILFRQRAEDILVIVVRHDKRDPRHGTSRM